MIYIRAFTPMLIYKHSLTDQGIELKKNTAFEKIVKFCVNT